MASFRYLCCIAAAVLASFAPAQAARNSITLGMQLEPPHLDPTSAAAGAIDQVLYANVFEGLTRFAADGSIIPGLARQWEISGDGRIYTFDLAPDVTFHDGSRMDARDVKFTLDRARAETSANAQKGLFTGISSIDILSDTRVRITLAEPDGQFLFNLAWGDAVIVAEESIADIRTTPVGTGPFRFNRWIKGDRIILKRNPDYWGEPALLEEATFRFIADPSASYAAMMAGDIDAFPGYPAPETLAQFEADPRFRVTRGSTEGETILAINNKAEHFSDRLVRKAVAHAIDRRAIIDGAMFGYGTPIGTHFAPHHPDYLDLTEISEYDPGKARALLAEAGYPDGFATTLKLPPPSYARRGGEIIQAQLRDVGISAEIITLEWAQWLEEVFRGKDYGLTIVSHTEPFDIGIYARPDYYFQYDNPAFQDLMARLKKENNPAERRRLSQQAQRIIAEDYVNGYLFQLPQTGVINRKIVGLWENAPTQATDLTAVYWQD
ncbi:ABC transporter substrate-binding protein [Alphaproteobacteria bacterium LSUCC0684]